MRSEISEMQWGDECLLTTGCPFAEDEYIKAFVLAFWSGRGWEMHDAQIRFLGFL
jgi:hypothetical protein